MAIVRQNVMTNAAARGSYINGVTALKNEFPTGATTIALGVPGPKQTLSTWDLFALWHGRAMSMNQNAVIHQGPVFPPWHRWMLLLLEANIARVLQQPSFGLPYWDWGADGARTPATQPASPVFGATAFGGGLGIASGGAQPALPALVPDGPFGSTSGFVVRVAASPTGIQSVARPLRRRLGALSVLPTNAEVTAALALTPYDAPPFDGRSVTGMRNQLEGWAPNNPIPPHLHNQVHVFIGGDMETGTSPNDPLFYLNHANIDRIWASWQQKHSALPVTQRYPTGKQVPAGHRLTDLLYSSLTNQLPGTPLVPKVNGMISVANLYSYDQLPN